MTGKNNLRKLYLVYGIIVGEAFCAVLLILSASNVVPDVLGGVMKIAGFAGIVLLPCVTFLIYKWLGKGNAASDELEQLVLTRAFAATGFVALTLLPFLLLLCVLFSEAAGYIVFGFAAVTGATFKLGTIIIYRKY